MPHVDLPTLDLRGRWPVNERERAVAADLVPLLPPAAESGADPQVAHSSDGQVQASDHLDSIESDVATLRRHLVEAAGS